MNWPINSRIVNGQRVTLQVVTVNGRKVPSRTLDRVIGDFRKYVAGEVHLMKDQQEVQVSEDAKGIIDDKQFAEVLASLGISGPSTIALVFGPRVPSKRPHSFCMPREDGSHVAWMWWSARRRFSFQRLLWTALWLPFRLLYGRHGSATYRIRHELYHTLGVPCQASHATDGHHCTHPDCILEAGALTKKAWLKAWLRTGRPWPRDLCQVCRGEIEQSQQNAGGHLIAPDEPYDPLDNLNQMVALNPDQPLEYLYRAEELANRGRLREALDDYDRSLALGAGERECLCRRNRGVMFVRLAQYEQAIQDWEYCLQLNGKDKLTLRNFAMLLASCPVQEVRDGRRAIELASRACALSDWKSPGDLALLASAHAEAGQFEKAIEYQDRAISLTDPSSAAELGRNLELYKSGQPLRIASS